MAADISSLSGVLLAVSIELPYATCMLLDAYCEQKAGICEA